MPQYAQYNYIIYNKPLGAVYDSIGLMKKHLDVQALPVQWLAVLLDAPAEPPKERPSK
jgi:hypothetical protein